MDTCWLRHPGDPPERVHRRGRVQRGDGGVWVSGNFDNVRVTRTGSGDTVLPTVSLTAPANGSTVSGTVAVSATASDNVGVAGVQFKLDGANLGAEDTAAPYTVSWNSASTTNGSHTLTAQARDAAGNRRAASVTVNVANGGATLPSPWLVGNVGTVGTPASASYANGVFTLDAGGTRAVGGYGRLRLRLPIVDR